MIKCPDQQNGIFSDIDILELINSKKILFSQSFDPKNLQPASLDLRLGIKAYRISASFIPGNQSRVKDKIKKLQLYEINLQDGAVLETGHVYIIELLENLDLPNDVAANANPKSSTGRLNIFTRILYDNAHQFDKVPKGYKGKLYVEVCPGSFPIKVRTGSTLSQIRFYKGEPQLKTDELIVLQKKETLIDSKNTKIFNQNINLSIDLSGDHQNIIGYRAKKHTKFIDIDQPESAKIKDFWAPLYKEKNQMGIILDPREFYIFSSQETVFIPALYTAEMKPFVAEMGEFRVHYAGFFDPGFGQRDKKGQGSKAVLEVRSRDLPFIVEHGQPIGQLIFEHMLSHPLKLYGKDINSHYQNQGLKLSKHFYS